MKRRNFLYSVPLAGLSLGLSGNLMGAISSQLNPENTFSPRVSFKKLKSVEKVKAAMFTMQRRAWEQGVAMQAMLEYGEEELVVLMAKDAVLNQSQDGRLAMVGEDAALSDAASPGEALLWAVRKTNDPALMKAYEKLLDYVMNKAPRTKEGIIYHFSNIPQVWSDINYMLPPFLAAAGKYEEAVKQISGVKGYLYNKEKKLLMHMWDCEKMVSPRKDFWGVGNGWTCAGLSRVISVLPGTMKSEKNMLIEYQKDLLDGCLAYMREDGLFHDVVDKPDTFVETNLAQMLTYSIYRGIKGGWIDKSYKAKADKMRKAVHGKVDSLGLVQGVCGAPNFDRSGVACEGQAFFILMETAFNALNS